MTPPRPKSRLAPAMIVAGFLCAMLGVYTASYLRCGFLAFAHDEEVFDEVFSHPRDEGGVRIVRTEWERKAYRLAALVEAQIRGARVELVIYPPPEGYYRPGGTSDYTPENPK